MFCPADYYRKAKDSYGQLFKIKLSTWILLVFPFSIFNEIKYNIQLFCFKIFSFIYKRLLRDSWFMIYILPFPLDLKAACKIFLFSIFLLTNPVKEGDWAVVSSPFLRMDLNLGPSDPIPIFFYQYSKLALNNYTVLNTLLD